MAVYYNEFDPFAAQWLRELIKCGFIADGEVDERSITEVKADDLKEFTQCHFFAGIGGWSYALRLAGVPDDARLWTGSCPCQAFSVAGKQKGFKDERHLWPVFSNLINQCKPSIVFGEQVETAIKHGWLDLVQDDLERYDYADEAEGILEDRKALRKAMAKAMEDELTPDLFNQNAIVWNKYPENKPKLWTRKLVTFINYSGQKEVDFEFLIENGGKEVWGSPNNPLKVIAWAEAPRPFTED